MRSAGQTDRELYCIDIDWLLNCSASALGVRGTIASVVNSLERGGGGSGIPNTDPYDDQQLGWCAGDGHVERLRRLEPIWANLPREAQAVLISHYTPRNDIQPDDRVAVYAEVRAAGERGVSLAGAAIYVSDGEQTVRLLHACRTPTKTDQNDKPDKNWPRTRKAIIDAARERAEEAVRLAHRIWHAVASLRPTKMPTARIEFHGVETQADRDSWEIKYAERMGEKREAALRLERAALWTAAEAKAAREAKAERKLQEKAARALLRPLGVRWADPKEKRVEGVQRAVAAE